MKPHFSVQSGSEIYTGTLLPNPDVLIKPLSPKPTADKNSKDLAPKKPKTFSTQARDTVEGLGRQLVIQTL